jgi:hypothetical protein
MRIANALAPFDFVVSRALFDARLKTSERANVPFADMRLQPRDNRLFAEESYGLVKDRDNIVRRADGRFGSIRRPNCTPAQFQPETGERRLCTPAGACH